MRRAIILLTLAIAACTNKASGPYPSLAPRSAEAIDPRAPAAAPVPSAMIDPALEARLAQLLGEVRAGSQDFASVEGEARRLAAAAGASGSDSWIAGQQALSVLIAARGRTTRALSDIDAIVADRLATVGAIAPANLAAIEAAANEAGAIDQHQAELIATLAARLR